jgi:hypothetical protein
MVKLLSLTIALALAGCAAQPQPAPRPVMVKIPIATPIYCDVPALQRPPLAIAMLTSDSPPADTIRFVRGDGGRAEERGRRARRDHQRMRRAGCERYSSIAPASAAPGSLGSADCARDDRKQEWGIFQSANDKRSDIRRRITQ